MANINLTVELEKLIIAKLHSRSPTIEPITKASKSEKYGFQSFIWKVIPNKTNNMKGSNEEKEIK